MKSSCLKSPVFFVAFLTTLIPMAALRPARGEEGRPVPQYIYKTVGERQLRADILYPEDWTAGDKRPAIVFFSGGAWRSGGTAQFLKQAQYFAKRGMVTIRAEYRDSTKDEARPDTCLKDAVSAMRWVRKNATSLGIDPQRIASSGGSAGGYLAAAVATIDGFHSEGDDLSVSPKPNAMVLFNPVLDFVTLDRAPEFGIVGELAIRISPLQHVESGLPPTLILIGSKDGFLEQNRQFVAKGEQVGTRMEIDVAAGQPHAYFNRSPWLEKTVASADRFLISLGYLDEMPRVALPTSPPRRTPVSLNLELRKRVDTGDGRFAETTRSVTWNPRKTAIIVCDMWDDHTCQGAARRVAEMAPAVDLALKKAREQGVFIIHAPSGTMSSYRDTPQRRLAKSAPFAEAAVEIKWNRWDPAREGDPLTAIVDGGCACPEPCPNFAVDEKGIRHWQRGGKIPWTRQIETIEIARRDAISDDGQEIFNLIAQRGIDNLILMGVHTNICVSGRPFGLRQMVYHGKSTVLCRDLTDALFQSTSKHIDQFRGTDMVVEHIEKHICPTITSTSLTGKPAFRFSKDVDHPQRSGR